MNAFPNLARAGFCYRTRLVHKATGRVLSESVDRNKVPVEGLDLMARALFAGGAVPAALYIGLHSGTHNPDGTETAANLGLTVSEITSYTSASRVKFEPGVVSGGGVSNETTVAVFDFTQAVVVDGAFISTSPAKGAAVGSLLSFVRFQPSRNVDPSVRLEVIAGFQFLSI